MTDQTLPSSPPVFVGDILKEARKLRGLSLAAVSKVLCITKAQLESLEEDKETLACNVYTIGFLKSYAQFLELNPTALIEKLKEQTAKQATPHRLIFPAPAPEKGMPSRRVGLLSLVGFVGFCGGYALWEKMTETSSQQAKPTVSTLPASKITPPTLIAPPQREPAPLSSTSASVRLTATENTWVEVKDTQGNVLLRRLLYQGESYTFAQPLGLTLKTGNAGGIRLVSGEKTLEFPGENGTIRREISLDASQWGAEE